MWTTRSEKLTSAEGVRFALDFDSYPATFEDVLNGWQRDATFRSLFNSLLADTEYTAFRWETPSITNSMVTRRFEFVLLNSPGLARHPDPNTFAEHFGGAINDIAVFSNLGRDAMMIVPLPTGNISAYGHLAAFVRFAPESQRHALWQSVGETMMRRLGTQPIWLNTAGAGVSWLHVRLDNKPKYYGYEPYRQGDSHGFP